MNMPNFQQHGEAYIAASFCLQLGGNKIVEKRKANENKVRYKLF